VKGGGHLARVDGGLGGARELEQPRDDAVPGGSTEGRALDGLRDIGGRIRVSYDTTSTRLHAKAWLFHRKSGFSTAYIGSSNLTHFAQVSGLEWNVRVSGARNPAVIDKVAAVFDSYWHNPDFKSYDQDEFLARTEAGAGGGPTILLSPTDLRPEPFQERLLEQIALSRQQGHHRNLLAAATGTGKTVMAALDYLRLRESLPRSRLLFVAHREEILTQSLGTFRQALRDPTFGELWVGVHRPLTADVTTSAQPRTIRPTSATSKSDGASVASPDARCRFPSQSLRNRRLNE
jgi:hypothetical protein